jgi:hypothetical protein
MPVVGYRRGARARQYDNPHGGHMSILDGGHDAPLSRRGRTIFGVILCSVVALGFLALVLTELAH